jgi:hypothetical protein
VRHASIHREKAGTTVICIAQVDVRALDRNVHAAQDRAKEAGRSPASRRDMMLPLKGIDDLVSGWRTCISILDK